MRHSIPKLPWNTAGLLALLISPAALAFEATVPEPNILALFGAGTVGLILFARHKRRK